MWSRRAGPALSRSEQQAVRLNLLWIAAVLAVLATARLLEPNAGGLAIPGIGVALPELCTFRRLLASDCPGCGLTRCFVLASRFQWAEAWAMQPVGVLLVVYLGSSLPLRLWQLGGLLAHRPRRWSLPWELGLIAILVAAAYLRWFVLLLTSMP